MIQEDTTTAVDNGTMARLNAHHPNKLHLIFLFNFGLLRATCDLYEDELDALRSSRISEIWQLILSPMMKDRVKIVAGYHICKKMISV